MNKIVLEKVKSQLERENEKIAELKYKFWERPEWDDKKAELEAEIEARQEWKAKLEASQETIVVMNNGGIDADVKKKVENREKIDKYQVDLTRSERPTGRIGFVS